MLCHNYNLKRLKDVCAKYGSSNIHAEWMRAECLVIFGSLIPDVSTDELIEKFAMETLSDYLARARSNRTKAIEGTYRPE